MNVLYVTADSPTERNSAVWRMEFPAKAINATVSNAAKLVQIVPWAEGQCKDESAWADVIVIQRNIMAGALTQAMSMIAKGKKVMVDLDDGYDYMPQSVISSRFWKNERFHEKPDDMVGQKMDFSPMEHLQWGCRLCTAVTAPSQVILDDRKRTGAKQCVLIPNYPDVEPYLTAKAKHANDEHALLTIGWAGGGTHTESFIDSGVMTALERVLANRKHVRFLLLGGTKEIYLRLRLEHIDRKEWVPYEQYHDNLAAIDIGLAPLAGPYDKRRSWLKAVEYGLMGIPWIGTNYGDDPQPYTGWEDHLVKNQVKYWEAALYETIDNYDHYKLKARAEQERAKLMDVHLHVGEILRAYEQA